MNKMQKSSVVKMMLRLLAAMLLAVTLVRPQKALADGFADPEAFLRDIAPDMGYIFLDPSQNADDYGKSLLRTLHTYENARFEDPHFQQLARLWLMGIRTAAAARSLDPRYAGSLYDSALNMCSVAALELKNGYGLSLPENTELAFKTCLGIDKEEQLIDWVEEKGFGTAFLPKTEVEYEAFMCFKEAIDGYDALYRDIALEYERIRSQHLSEKEDYHARSNLTGEYIRGSDIHDLTGDVLFEYVYVDNCDAEYVRSLIHENSAYYIDTLASLNELLGLVKPRS